MQLLKVDGLAALLGAQLLTRLASFALAVLTARFAPPAEYGISYVSLQLFATLSLSRCSARGSFRETRFEDPFRSRIFFIFNDSKLE